MSYSSRLVSLLSDLARAMEKARLDYAVGGAVAMAAYGYERNTNDIDLFANADQKPQVLALLRKMGLEVVPVFRGAHYLARVPGVPLTRLSVDILFPSQDPDWSAVDLPETVKLDGVRFEAFPLPLLFLAKAQAIFDKGDPDKKHESDLRHLVNEGFVTENDVLPIARRMRMVNQTKALFRRLRKA